MLGAKPGQPQTYYDEPERLTAALQTQLTPSACTAFYEAARKRHLTPSALLRVIVLEWMEQDGIQQ